MVLINELIGKIKAGDLKIIAKKITISDIEKYIEESVDFDICIYPNIYNKLKLYPIQGDIIFGYKKQNFDHNEDCEFLIRDYFLYYLI